MPLRDEYFYAEYDSFFFTELNKLAIALTEQIRRSH